MQDSRRDRLCFVSCAGSAISKLRKHRSAGGSGSGKSELLPLHGAETLVRIGLVKSVATLLLLSAFALTACNNLVTRRDQYRPANASGPYTEARRTGKLPTQEQLAVARATPAPDMEPSAEAALPNP